jgi:hypothetical protein
MFMKKTILYSCTVLVLAGSLGCNNQAPENKEEAAKPVAAPVALVPVGKSPEFAEAKLSVSDVKAEKVGTDSAKVSFAFTVQNYELKAQTADNAGKGCNNSDKGQHIHFVLDNTPYKALYEPKNEVTLPVNTEHNLICFLSRSYHEALKNKDAAVVYKFKIDEKGKLIKMAASTEPALYYSRPKGDYLGKDTANILLDFYLANCTLSDTGYYLTARVTNENRSIDTTFNITTWQPFFLQNLGTGKCGVTLTLNNKTEPDKKYTIVSRTFNMAAAEPIK